MKADNKTLEILHKHFEIETISLTWLYSVVMFYLRKKIDLVHYYIRFSEYYFLCKWWNFESGNVAIIAEPGWS